MVTERAGGTGARLMGLGAYRPARTVTNDDLAKRVTTSDAWIRSRTGI
jgi:3-oxoacyl-[acyl-carrier-protein] synthase-3